MKLKLENVGKIESADIKLDGITVIAGENNSGKSTVGKMLFSIFSSFYKIEEQVSDERVKAIFRVLSNYYHEEFNLVYMNSDIKKWARKIIDNKDIYKGNIKELKNLLINLFNNSIGDSKNVINQDRLDNLVSRINENLQIEDEEIRKVILRKRLNAEFAMKINHLNYENNVSKIELNVKNGKISFEVIDNDEIVINDSISLVKEIIYIDDPFVLDDLDYRIPWSFITSDNHRTELIEKIVSKESKNEFSVIDELRVQHKLDKIFNSMNDVCDGELQKSEGGSFVYKTDKLNGSLNIVNLSTGMKSFVILRKLLQNGSIDDNGIIILDEPEIHLHPEWQLKFAEIIVLIQKEFGMNILLNTHSPYFLNAIEVYSQKYNIENRCNYYMTKQQEMRSTIIDVTGKVEKIYEKLADPLQKLEDMEYRI